MFLTRRKFMGWGTALGAGAVVGLGATALFRRDTSRAPDLVPDPQGVLDLARGFRYRVLERSGDRMSDGAIVRPLPDGMATFVGPGGEIIVMRNHEMLAPGGGVSRLVLDPKTYERVSSNDVLRGTNRNCAGGPSPWGWLTCEEVDDGGVWICPTSAHHVLEGADRRRLDAYGTFRHEAVAIDPARLSAHLTEDHPEGALYRFMPTAASRPFDGSLQAMRVAGQARFDTGGMTAGATVRVEWVDVRPARAHVDAIAAGAARVVRGEGAWWFDDRLYFSATELGQIFELVPDRAGDGASLRLISRSLAMPDNITVSPTGKIFVAEDNFQQNHVWALDSSGHATALARNAINPRGEFAGVCFVPSGDALLVNLQLSGLTLIITGPFAEFG